MKKISRTVIGYVITIIFFLCLITSGIICQLNGKKERKENLKYSIAFTTKKIHVKGTYVYYYYYYQGKKIENDETVYSKIKVPDGIYYIEFPCMV
jgi:cbb3-type cytochrome oxidase subunit 3